MLERIKQEIELVRTFYGSVEVSPNSDWLLIPSWPLPVGWSAASTCILVLLPAGYPTTPPDNFYTDNDLRLAGGGQPRNTTLNQQIAGRQWLQFSFHVESGDWKPARLAGEGHNLLTFLNGVLKRLVEAS